MEDALRDRIVCRVKDSRVQKKLLVEQKLTFKQAFETALAMEIAEKHAKYLQPKHVHQLSRHREGCTSSTDLEPEGYSCYRCGGSKHSPANCNYKDVICLKCKIKGHLERVCRSKTSMNAKVRGRGQRKQTNVVEVDEFEQNSDSEVYSLFNVNNKKEKAYTTTANVNGSNGN